MSDYYKNGEIINLAKFDQSRIPPKPPNKFWRYNKSNNTIVHIENIYNIDLDSCTNAKDLLDYLLQINEKNWCSPQCLKDLVSIFEDVCYEKYKNNLQGMYCQHHHDRFDNNNQSNQVTKNYYQRLKENAKLRRLKFNVSVEYLNYLLQSQNNRCKLTGEEIFFSKMKGQNTASLDRIDSSKGYIEGNVQWINKRINKLKSTFNQIELIDLCKKVAENQS